MARLNGKTRGPGARAAAAIRAAWWEVGAWLVFVRAWWEESGEVCRG